MTTVSDLTRDTSIHAQPITGAPFGIEVVADLTSSFTPEEKAGLRRLYLQDGLLLFRGQRLSMEQQIEACNIFGPVLRNHLDNYLVSNVHEDGLLGKRELLFHNDIPYVPAPYLGASLHAIEVDEGVSATRYASSFRAWDRLPSDLKRRVQDLNVLHIKGRAIGQRTRMADLKPKDNCAVHALIGQQEETSRQYIFACIEMAGVITGLSEDDSESLLQELFSYLYTPEEIYEHRWQVGDIVIWNNLAIQHARSEITGGRRTLQRVSIAEHGYWDQYPVDLPIYDAMLEVKNGFMTL